MKCIISACVMAAILGLVGSVRAAEGDGASSHGFTNADINGGYGCNASGTISGADTVATAQYHPQGDGTFSEAAFTLQIAGIGVCLYSLEPGTGTLNVSANGTGFAQATYSRLSGSAANCPAVFPSHISFVCSGAKVTADTCDIATLDTGVLLSGTCKKQNK